MPRPNRGKRDHRSVTSTRKEDKNRRGPLRNRPNPPAEKEAGTTSISIPYNMRYNEKSFRKWLENGASREGERMISIRKLEFFQPTHMIHLVIATEDVTLLKKVCESGPYSGMVLVPRIESVGGASAASKAKSFEQAFKLLIQERYNSATAVLDLNGVSKHPDPNRCINWGDINAGKALCNVLKLFCTGCKEIILDNNDLSNLSTFREIARACPTVERLSLMGNKISDFTQFKFIDNLRLRVLKIANNPICNLDKKVHLNEAKKYFPRLEVLDDTQVGSMRFFDPCMLIDGIPLCELPTVKGSFLTPDTEPVAQGFVSTFLTKLSDPSTPVTEVASMYDQDAFMSVSLAPDKTFKQSLISQFQNINRNLIKDSSTKSVKEFLFCGKDRIAQAIKSSPVFSIPKEMLVCDAIDLTPFSKMTGVRFVQLCFSGNANFQDEHFSFRRVFILWFVGDRWFIRNDMLTILPELGKNIALDTGLVMDVANKEELTKKLATEGHVVPDAARDILIRCGWNIQAAAQMLVTLRQTGQIPAHLCT